MEGVTITLSEEKSMELFADALANAVGIGYMSGYGLVFDCPEYDKFRKKLLSTLTAGKSICMEDVWMAALEGGSTLRFIDEERDGDNTKSITKADVCAKVSLMPIRNLTNLLEENGDVEDADVLLQTVFFDKVIFG